MTIDDDDVRTAVIVFFYFRTHLARTDYNSLHILKIGTAAISYTNG